MLHGLDQGPASRRIEAYFHIALDQISEAAEALERLVTEFPEDGRLVNDLGVLYLKLGRDDVTYLFAAVTRFRKATSLAAAAPEPKFNLALAYREVHLPLQFDESIKNYMRTERNALWARYLLESPPGPDTEPLRRALEQGDNEDAWRLTEDDPEAWWQLLMEVLENPDERSRAQLDSYLTNAARYNDSTSTAMLRPLLSEDRERVVHARRLVQEGLETYRQARFEDSVQMFDQASRLLVGSELEFDRFWVAINRAGALVWNGGVAEARAVYESVADSGRDQNLNWIVGRTLSAYGSDPALAARRVVTIDRLREAIRLFETIGARHESARARFYLSTYLLLEGSVVESLAVATATFDLVAQDDHARRQQLHWVTSRSLAALGRADQALDHQVETIRRADLGGVPASRLQFNVELAQMHEAASEPDLADARMAVAEAVFEEIETSNAVKGMLDVILTFGKAKIQASRNQPSEVIQTLTPNLPLLTQPSFDVFYRHQYRLALAEANQALGRATAAAGHFASVVEAIEGEDDQLAPRARLAFDQSRRSVYEQAIGFLLDRGDIETAWRDTQGYRQKLLTEMLDQYVEDQGFANQLSRSGRGDALEDHVVLEHMILDDRVLLWVASDGSLEVREHAVRRDDLQEKVERFGQLLQARAAPEKIDTLSEELYRILIEPVADLIDGSDSLTIVPDGLLNRLPYRALLSPAGRHLIEDFSVMQTPSLAYFLNTQLPGREGKLVSLGSRDQSVAIQAELNTLGQLYDSIEEFDGVEIDKATFLDALSDAWLVHYAGHSAFDGNNALSSSIRLDGSAEGPNLVTAREIADQRLAPNALVVLSSCDSAVGNSTGGAGVRGLTSAFIIAGAGSVVGSLWPVETTATAQLMGWFHESVAAGVPIALALRMAQVRMIERGDHPFYWAAFTINGNQTALESAPFAAPVAESAVLSQ